MRRYAHKTIAALLCMFLLISYTPLPASASDAPTGPSVSEEGEAQMVAPSVAQATTTVNVLVLGPAIVSKSDDIAAKRADIAGDAARYDLRVVATGQGHLTYAWTRTVDGVDDAAFSYSAVDDGTYALSKAAADGDLEDGKTYVYTVQVTDESGASVKASISVTVSSEYAYRVMTDEPSGITVGASAHWQADLYIDALDPASPTYACLQAAAPGAIIAGAWHVNVAGAPEDKPAFVGTADVALPAPGIADGETVQIVGLDASGAPLAFEATVSDGKATFASTALGAFAVAWVDPAAPVHTIAASAGEGGQLSPSGDVRVADGASVTFTALADAGYALDKVTVDGEAVEAPGGVLTLSDVREGHAVRATFRAVDVDLDREHTVSARVVDGNGAVSVEGSEFGETSQVDVKHGAPAVVTLAPSPGYVVDRVTVDKGAGAEEAPVLAGAVMLSAVEDDVQIEVSHRSGIEPPLPTYAVTATVSEGGTVSPERADVPHGGSVSFSVVPDPGCRLAALTLDGADALGKLKGNTLTVENVVSNRTVHAVFEPVPEGTYTVSASAGEGGSLSPAGMREAAEGSSLTFYVYPDEGCRLAKLMLQEGDSAPIEVTDRVVGGVFVLEDIRENYELAATFEPSGIVVPDDTYYTVDARSGEGGSISPEGTMRVLAGSSCTFTIVPNEGYAVDALLVDGQPVALAGFAYTVEGVWANMVIEATFRPLGGDPAPDVPLVHAIEASAGAGGSISPAGAVSVPEGGSMPFSFIPQAGYEVSRVLVDDRAVDVSASYRFDDVRGDHTIKVEFQRVAGSDDLELFTVTASAGEGGAVSPAGSVPVAKGSSQTFSFIPDPDFKVKSVTVDGVAKELSETSYTLYGIEADTELSVAFEPSPGAVEPTTHLVSASSSAGGLILPEGDVQVVDGAGISFSFAPFAGYELYRVAVDGIDVPADEWAGGFYRIDNVRGEHGIRAYFSKKNTTPVDPDDPDKPEAYAVIEATAGEGGAIDPAGSVPVPLGSSQTFSFEPHEGYEVDRVMVNGQVVDASSSYTFQNVRTGGSIETTFKPIKAPEPNVYTVSASCTSGGTITPRGPQTVVEGDDALFRFAPDEGYRLAHLLVDGRETQPAVEGEFSFSQVSAAHTVRAVFERIPDGPAPDEPPYVNVDVQVKVTVDATSQAGGEVEPSYVTVPRGTERYVLYAFPEEGFTLDYVKVDGVEIEATPIGAAPVSASYALRSRAAVFVNERAATAGGFQFVVEDIQDDMLIEVAFRPLGADEDALDPVVQHRVSAEALAGGSVTPTTMLVPDGGQATVVAKPDAGYHLASFTLVQDGSERDVTGDAAQCVLTLPNVTGDALVRAEFEKDEPAPAQHVVNASAGLHGAISPSGAVKVDDGADQAFAFVPDEGYVVDEVLVDYAPVSDPGTGYRFADVREGHDIHVTFRAEGEDPTPPPEDPTYFTVTARVSGGHGSIEPSGAVRVEKGSAQTFSFRPDAGFEVSALIVDGERRAFAASSYRMEDVQADRTVEVEFAALTAPAPQDPVDGAGRTLRQVTRFVQTGDANGPLALATIALASAAAAATVVSRRRLCAERQGNGKGGRR